MFSRVARSSMRILGVLAGIVLVVGCSGGNKAGSPVTPPLGASQAAQSRLQTLSSTSAASPAAAVPVTITVTGTVLSGTDSTTASGANVFGVGTALAKQLFTLVIHFNGADGTTVSNTCGSGGPVWNTSDSASDTSPSGTLTIGSKSFAYGILPRTASWTINRTTMLASCGGLANIGFNYGENYTPNNGQFAFGGAGIYLPAGDNFPSGDWRTTVPESPVSTKTASFPFHIGVVSTTAPHPYTAYAYGELIPTSISVDGVPAPCAVTSQTVVTIPTDRTRTAVGVDELVNLTTQGTGITWSINGVGTISRTDTQSTQFDAGNTPGTSTITATGTNCSSSPTTFNIIQPTGIVDALETQVLNHYKGSPDIGVLLNVYLTPDTVSFSRVGWLEWDANAEATGAYADFNGHSHGPQKTFTDVGDDVPGRGSKVAGDFVDRGYTGEACSWLLLDGPLGLPYVAGYEKIVIPNAYARHDQNPYPTVIQPGNIAGTQFTTTTVDVTLTNVGDKATGGLVQYSKAGASAQTNVNAPSSTPPGWGTQWPLCVGPVTTL
jgi:hypothetical protein